MNRRLRFTPPKQTLADRAGKAMKPIGLPSGLKILTPSCLSLTTPTAPKIAVDVAPEAVRRPARLGGDESAAVSELAAVVDHVVGTDHARRHAGFDDVELGLVGREGEAVRAVDVAGDDGRPAGLVEAIDVGRQFGGRDVTLIVALECRTADQ
jgi:hypothetical protein